MPSRVLAIFFCSAILFFFNIHASALENNFILRGTRIFSEKELIRILDLGRYPAGRRGAAQAAAAIAKFYRANGYTLVKVYVVKAGSGNPELFIDEGRLGRIVVHDLHPYYAVRVKHIINIPGRIYNRQIVGYTLDSVRDNFNIRGVRAELKKTRDYSANLIQLDRDFPGIDLWGGRIEFFDKYPPAYDLHYYVEKKNGNILGRDSEEVRLGLDYDFPSELKPELTYVRRNFLLKQDYFRASVSAGFDFGLKGIFKYPPANTLQMPPERTFAEARGEYRFKPAYMNYFSPLVKADIYHSNSSRSDLGLEQYQFLRSRGMFAPGFELLRSLNVNAGIGGERIRFYDSRIDPEADQYISVENRDDGYPYFEFQAVLDSVPLWFMERLERNIVFTYHEFFAGISSREFRLKAAFDAEFDDFSILRLRARGLFMQKSPPFYHQQNVSSSCFRGFTGRNYYTERKACLSLEYRFSVYRDYVYTGFFTDWVIFRAEGFEISGIKQGLVAGPLVRMLFYDQFEGALYFGYDRLYPDGVSGTNIKISLSRKW